MPCPRESPGEVPQDVMPCPLCGETISGEHLEDCPTQSQRSTPNDWKEWLTEEEQNKLPEPGSHEDEVSFATDFARSLGASREEAATEREMRLEAEAQRASADRWGATMRREHDAMKWERDASQAQVARLREALGLMQPMFCDDNCITYGEEEHHGYCALAKEALALTEADMLKRQEEK